jgi:hypothetical protein
MQKCVIKYKWIRTGHIGYLDLIITTVSTYLWPRLSLCLHDLAILSQPGGVYCYRMKHICLRIWGVLRSYVVFEPGYPKRVQFSSHSTSCKPSRRSSALFVAGSVSSQCHCFVTRQMASTLMLQDYPACQSSRVYASIVRYLMRWYLEIAYSASNSRNASTQSSNSSCPWSSTAALKPMLN